MIDVFIYILAFIVVFALIGAIVLNWERTEDKYYYHQLRRHPGEYSICAECGRPRPNKKMTHYLGKMYCDIHMEGE